MRAKIDDGCSPRFLEIRDFLETAWTACAWKGNTGQSVSLSQLLLQLARRRIITPDLRLTQDPGQDAPEGSRLPAEGGPVPTTERRAPTPSRPLLWLPRAAAESRRTAGVAGLVSLLQLSCQLQASKRRALLCFGERTPSPYTGVRPSGGAAPFKERDSACWAATGSGGSGARLC